jgi:transposase
MTSVTCHNCGYEWDYKGNLEKATCPGCSYKTDVDGE